jgi:hypothetical protein
MLKIFMMDYHLRMKFVTDVGKPFQHVIKWRKEGVFSKIEVIKD